MKTKQAWRILAVAAAALGCSGAFADSMNMTVQASVTGTCKMQTVPTIDFGTLDPSNAVAVNPAASSITYKCTKGTAPTSITLNTLASPFNGSLSNGVDNIAYQISWTNPTGVAAQGSGFGTGSSAISVSLTPTMAAGAYANVSSGSYSQTVAVAINP